MKKENKFKSLLFFIKELVIPKHPAPARDWFVTLLLFSFLNLVLIVYSAYIFFYWETPDDVQFQPEAERVSLTEKDLQEAKEIFKKRDSRYQALILDTGEISFPPDPSVSEEEEEDEDDDELPDQEGETEDDEGPGQDEEGVETTESDQEEIPEN